MFGKLLTITALASAEYSPGNESYAPAMACFFNKDKVGCVYEQVLAGTADAYYLQVDAVEPSDIGCGNNTLIGDYAIRTANSTENATNYFTTPPNMVFVTGMADGDKDACVIKAYGGAVSGNTCPTATAAEFTVNLADMTNAADATSFRIEPVMEAVGQKLIIDASACKSAQHFYIGYRFDKDTLPGSNNGGDDSAASTVLLASAGLALTVSAFTF